MFLAERLISIVAPHVCLVCGTEGSLLCEWCQPDAVLPLPSRCYRCNKATKGYAVCDACKKKTPLRHDWPVTELGGTPQQLVYFLKFGRAQAAVQPMSQMMNDVLPYLEDYVVVPVPTATTRVRNRGYDQSVLLARALAVRLNCHYLHALRRLGQSRQLTANREKRLAQLRGAYYVPSVVAIKGRDVLLVDDVMTTGATLETAARALKKAGAKSVNAAVFARKT